MSQRGKTMERPQNNTAEDLLLFYNTDQHFWERRGTSTTMSQGGNPWKDHRITLQKTFSRTWDSSPQCQFSWELTTPDHNLWESHHNEPEGEIHGKVKE